ncbi:conserved hypothetical protein [Histoplasma capsulatum var. duboisii H88]|uniref:Uncharacterized protein n=1 Tax=Ajellomyces capsulatus (strain H88) TaxID=544711 RepID=F0U9P3_AJEC8|nr:conserved hypothetical protein [Histoplasma capsulatum var. duboisii H88]QSS51657.1 hypothetical protein I7I53_07029 [Histoplasma capsulatum var. duboisii H88]
MNFINYSPFHPEPKTLKAHWHHFPSAGPTSKMLPSKPIRLHHHPSLPSPPARPNHFCCAQSSSLATSLSSQFPPVPPQTHPLPNHPPSSSSSHKHSGYRQNQSPTVLPNDFDRVFDENVIVDGFIESRATDLTADIISCSDGGAEDESWKGRSQEQKKDTSAALEPFSSAITPRPALVPERLGDGASIPLPASEEYTHLLDLDGEMDETQNHEWLHGSLDAPIVIQAETGTKNMSAAQRSSAFSVEPYQRKRKTVTHNTAQSETAFPGPHRLSETEPMQPMVAVVVPSISRCHREDAATHRLNESGQHVPVNRQQKTRPKPKRKALRKSCHIPLSPTPPADDNTELWDTISTSDPTDNSDGDYTASRLDSGDSVKQQSKRCKFSSRPAATMSHRPQSPPRGARAVDYHRDVERAPCSVQSVAVTDRSASSTPAGYKSCTPSCPVAPTHGFEFEHALNPRLLSPEDISALVSAFAQKLLDLRRDSSTDTEHAVTHTESVSVDKDQRIVKPDRKRPRWTREEDERLKDLKTRGWRWWEIEQQFPLRRLSALQQRWFSKLRAGVSAGD